MKRNERISKHIDPIEIRINVDNTRYSKGKKEQLYIFSTRLNDLLFEKGIHQDEFAEMVDIGVTSISKYRNGYVLPNIEFIEKIAKGLNVSSEYLLGKSITKNYSNNEINKMFGLNDVSINILKGLKNNDALNLLFNNDEIELEFLFEEMKKYRDACIRLNEYKINHQDIDIEKDKTYIELRGNVQFASFNISQTVIRLIDNNIK